ncbi:hypothetical protein CEXT_37881 [Caerostris extrusa]|uniref:Uncharacterized protein n=1 Tax=Caerostris extrusa TaxID=172846 RepID=A0AAV4TSY3_CAEEX|nr:hypothetical protein CEXT_37881 [Caerostris extrusa]
MVMLSTYVCMIALVVMLCSASESAEMARTPLERNVIQLRRQIKRPTVIHPLFKRQLRRPPSGATVPFCSMFNCNCTPPPGKKSCDNYRYDSATQKCRYLL